MNTQKFDVARPLSLLLGAWVVFLHVCFRVSAGPLWRD